MDVITRFLLLAHKHPEPSIHSFATLYSCQYLLYYEHFSDIIQAIYREKELKGWSRKKKEGLINENNPEWQFLREDER